VNDFHSLFEFVIVASDGLWDNMTTNEACRIAKKSLLQDRCASKTAQALVAEASRRTNRDNVTCIVVVNLAPPLDSL
jgi:serine/threonine protein phosphatase PrpC